MNAEGDREGDAPNNAHIVRPFCVVKNLPKTCIVVTIAEKSLLI